MRTETQRPRGPLLSKPAHSATQGGPPLQLPVLFCTALTAAAEAKGATDLPAGGSISALRAPRERRGRCRRIPATDNSPPWRSARAKVQITTDCSQIDPGHCCAPASEELGTWATALGPPFPSHRRRAPGTKPLRHHSAPAPGQTPSLSYLPPPPPATPLRAPPAPFQLAPSRTLPGPPSPPPPHFPIPPARPPPPPAAGARSTCVTELALLLLLLAIETALGGGGGGGSGGGSGCPIDTSRPARGEGEPALRRTELRRRVASRTSWRRRRLRLMTRRAQGAGHAGRKLGAVKAGRRGCPAGLAPGLGGRTREFPAPGTRSCSMPPRARGPPGGPA